MPHFHIFCFKLYNNIRIIEAHLLTLTSPSLDLLINKLTSVFSIVNRKHP